MRFAFQLVMHVSFFFQPSQQSLDRRVMDGAVFGDRITDFLDRDWFELPDVPQDFGLCGAQCR